MIPFIQRPIVNILFLLLITIFWRQQLPIGTHLHFFLDGTDWVTTGIGDSNSRYPMVERGSDMKPEYRYIPYNTDLLINGKYISTHEANKLYLIYDDFDPGS